MPWDFMVQITDVYYGNTQTMVVCGQVFFLSSVESLLLSRFMLMK